MASKSKKTQKKPIRCAENEADFSIRKEEYFTALRNHPIPKINNNSTLSIIYSTKQAKPETQIAIYKNISFFEAVNRIATDLVFWQGINEVLENLSWDKIEKIEYCLGNENSPDHGDFTIKLKSEDKEELEGEVFFAAPSYFPTKMRNTLEKWEEDKKLRYVLFNSNAASEDNIQKLTENNPNISFISVELSE